MFTTWLKQQHLRSWGTKKVLQPSLWVPLRCKPMTTLSNNYIKISLTLQDFLVDNISQDNFQALLVASGLGSLRKNGQFIFKKNQFDICNIRGLRASFQDEVFRIMIGLGH